MASYAYLITPTEYTASITIKTPNSIETFAVVGVGQGRRLSAWHLPGGPVGSPARWAATSNVGGRSGTEEGSRGP